eukprot:1157398-Pelagomonas_calceolata.AAC.11
MVWPPYLQAQVQSVVMEPQLLVASGQLHHQGKRQRPSSCSTMHLRIITVWHCAASRGVQGRHGRGKALDSLQGVSVVCVDASAVGTMLELASTHPFAN